MFKRYAELFQILLISGSFFLISHVLVSSDNSTRTQHHKLFIDVDYDPADDDSAEWNKPPQLGASKKLQLATEQINCLLAKVRLNNWMQDQAEEKQDQANHQTQIDFDDLQQEQLRLRVTSSRSNSFDDKIKDTFSSTKCHGRHASMSPLSYITTSSLCLSRSVSMSSNTSDDSSKEV